MVYDKASQRMLLFGGGVGGGLLDDTWMWDGSDWTELFPAHRPPARSDFGLTFDEKRQSVILFGGNVIAFEDTDTWEWIGDDWVRLGTLQEPPEMLSYDAKLAYFPWFQEVVLLNDHRIKYFDDDGNISYTDHLEGWALTDRYANFLPLVSSHP
jgi:hypothetical protein